MISVVIAAGGKGTRMGGKENKVFLKLLDKEIIVHTMQAFENHDDIDEIIVVSGEGEHMRIAELAHEHKISKFRVSTTGGKTRQESVKNGLCFASGEIVLIHDGARALISEKEISDVIFDAKKYGAAALGVHPKDTLKAVDEEGFITATTDREMTYNIHTPQAFLRDTIIEGHQKAIDDKFVGTDDCSLVERLGKKIKITEGSYENIKLTTPEDMFIGEEILKKRECR